MKTYLLSFVAPDFSKDGKIWSTQGIDLYANKYYTNYSYSRSPTGLNSTGDFVFTGTEVLSNATPTIAEAVEITNYRRIGRR